MNPQVIKCLDKIQGILDRAIKGGPGSGPHGGHGYTAAANKAQDASESAWDATKLAHQFSGVYRQSSHSRAVEYARAGNHPKAIESHNAAAAWHQKWVDKANAGIVSKGTGNIHNDAVAAHKLAAQLHEQAQKLA